MKELSELLTVLGDLDAPIARRDLKLLSDLDQAQLAQFCAQWPAVPGERRSEIVRTLAEMAEDNVDLDFRQVFRACLDDAEGGIRAQAIDGLWEDNRVQTLYRLVALLHDPAGDVRAAAAVGLSRFAYQAEMGELNQAATEQVFQSLMAALLDPDQPMEVRRRALEALGYFGGSPDVQAEIGRAYAHEDQYMRESALVAMGRSMRATWFPYIERELRSISPALRYEAARAVGEIGAEAQALLPALLPLVDDDDEEVSLAAIWSLGQVGGPNARRVLQRLARSKDEARSQAAEDALSELMLEEL